MEIKISSRLRTQCIRALSESMETRTMTHLIRELFPDYDIHARTGFPESLAIPNVDVARQIVKDVIDAERFVNFVALLIKIQEEGAMGRRYPIAYLRDIIKGVYDMGFIYDKVNRMFVEDPHVRHTRNWGVLQPGVEYTMGFLAVDIVGNSDLVKNHSDQAIQQTYQDLRDIVHASIIKRNGRIWHWEGDGGLAAFFFGNKHMSAAASAMEILHELFIYNRIRCRLEKKLKVRIGVHGGPCEYTDNEEELEKIVTVNETVGFEKKSPSDTVTISVVVKVMLEDIISQKFKAVGSGKNGPFAYSLVLE